MGCELAAFERGSWQRDGKGAGSEVEQGIVLWVGGRESGTWSLGHPGRPSGVVGLACASLSNRLTVVSLSRGAALEPRRPSPSATVPCFFIRPRRRRWSAVRLQIESHKR